jgi:hypothetical protein
LTENKIEVTRFEKDVLTRGLKKVEPEFEKPITKIE